MAKRIIILLTVPLLLWLTVPMTAANIFRQKAPDVALLLSPNDAGALAKRNDFGLAQDSETGKWRVSSLAALSSLRSEGLNPRAVRQLAFVAENDGDDVKTKRLIAAAEKMTRRDVGAQLWLANHWAAKNDIGRALKHIDIGLKTVPESGSLLFPLLASALDQPEFQAQFAPYIAASPQWISSFIDYSLGKRVKLDILARSIVSAGGLRKSGDSDKLNLLLLNHLASAGHYRDILPYYQSLKMADPRLARDIALTATSINPAHGPLAWTTVQNVDVDAAIVTSEGPDPYQMDISVGQAKRRVAAQKLLYLSEGSYAVNAAYLFSEGGREAAVGWQISCVGGASAVDLAAPLYRASEIQQPEGKMEFRFIVPPNCSSQLLKLTAVGGSEGTITRITIRRPRILKQL